MCLADLTFVDIAHTICRMSTKHYETPAQIAQSLNLKTATVQHWCRDKKLPAHKIGRHWLIEVPLAYNMLEANETIGETQ